MALSTHRLNTHAELTPPLCRCSSRQSRSRSSQPRSSSRPRGATASYSRRAATASTRTARGRRGLAACAPHGHCTGTACAPHMRRIGTAWARRAPHSAGAARRLDPDRASHRAPPPLRAAARAGGGRLDRRNPCAAACLLGKLHAAARGLRLRAPLCRPLVRSHRCAPRALPRAPLCWHETAHCGRRRWWRWRWRWRRRRRRRAKVAASEGGDGVTNPGWRRVGHRRLHLTEQTPPPHEKTGGNSPCDAGQLRRCLGMLDTPGGETLWREGVSVCGNVLLLSYFLSRGVYN